MNSHFLIWLERRTKWPLERGWTHVIGRRYRKPESAFASFFKFVDEYRKLRPTLLYTTEIGADQQPTGNRICYGLDGRMDKPDRVEIVRYRPEPLHFLRFHYGGRIEDGDLLMDGNGSTPVRHDICASA